MVNPFSFTGVTSKGALTVKEVDGSPDVPQVNTIVVSNGTLTNDGGGVVTITTGGGGAGVDSWAGGTTGLLPSGATTGVVSISGTLVVANGGTGATTLTDGGVLLGSGTGAITPLGQATDGQLVIGSTGADPVLATLTNGTGITITEGTGTITITADNNGTMSSFILSDGIATQTIVDGNTLTVSGGTGLTSNVSATDTVTLVLDDTAVAPAAYTSADITVDAQGRITAAASGSGGGTGADPTAQVGPLAVNGVATTFLRSDGAPALEDTSVAAGSYTATDITVDAQGRLTAASSGAAAAITATANGLNDRIATYSAATELNGEANLTFSGSILAVTGALTTSTTAKIGTDLEIDGSLNHDGSTVGFFGFTPRTQSSVSGLVGPPDTVANALAITEILNALGDGVAGVGLFAVI